MKVKKGLSDRNNRVKTFRNKKIDITDFKNNFSTTLTKRINLNMCNSWMDSCIVQSPLCNQCYAI